MFDDLKAQRGGIRPRERARLTLTVAACLVVGAGIFGLKSCAEAPEKSAPVTSSGVPPASTRPLPMGPLEALRTRTDAPAAFDGPSLEHVLRELARGGVRRDPDLYLSPAEVASVSPAEATGKTIEVAGRVKNIDLEEYAPKDLPGVEALWAFALVGDDGKEVVVVQGGEHNSFDRGRPVDAFHAAPTLILDDMYVRVRGVYLQRRTGGIARVTLDGPTPVLVGREYLRSVPPPTPIAGVAGANFAAVHDRVLAETFSAEEDAHWQLLVWLRARGHDAVLDDIRAGRIPTRTWDRDAFLRWSRELERDTDSSKPDPRTWTNEARGKVFVTTGALVDFVKEDWEALPPNAFGVGARWQTWILSDHYRNVPLRFDGAFPRQAYKGVWPPPKKGAKDQRPQRVRLYGVFVKNWSYVPKGALDRKEDERKEVTIPHFVLLHVEPDPPPEGMTLLENPFFWAWVSLLVFGVLFFGVMSRVERREAGALHEQQLKMRKRQREKGVPGMSPDAPRPAPSGRSRGPGGEGGPAPPPSGAPS